MTSKAAALKAEQEARTKAVEAAATEWLRAKAKLAAVKDAEAALRRAEKILKPWFEETGHTSIEVASGGIGSSITTSTVLDVELLRAHLGKRVGQFEKQQIRRTLFVLGAA